MKHIFFTSFFVGVLVLGVVSVPNAHALSCLPVDTYLEDVVGKDEIVIFVGKSKDRIEETDYTVEVLTVSEVKQGYVEEETFVYHQKDMAWGYLCNNGPKAKGTEGVYVGTRDAYGKYLIYQRLELSDPLVAALNADLEDAEVTGETVELSKTDRMNQILTTISDLFKEIGVLLKEYVYWKG